MNKRIGVGVSAVKLFRVLFVFILSALVGQAIQANAQTLTTLHSFGPSPDGAQPNAALVQGGDGNFYGTTYSGGTNGFGTLFRISPGGMETNLYSFTVNSQQNNSTAGMVQGSDGNFYGTTPRGYGTVFRISPSGTYTTLYAFHVRPGAGKSPQAGLAQGSDGNFYGTTSQGGMHGAGIVFRISPSGTETNLYSFGIPTNDGLSPGAGLVQGSDGDFYGTTYYGGINYSGTVFRISPSGSFTSLYSFAGFPTDGSFPQAILVQGRDGNFYSTTASGGAYGAGTVFRISPGGMETNLYSFGSFPNDGSSPAAGLVQGSDGNFYGTTEFGGVYGGGTVFRISPSGNCTSLYSFVGYPGGAGEPNGLVQGNDGNFYGTTWQGGTYTSGTIFQLIVPLNPPANQISAVQIAASDLAFSIPSVAYETYQLQFSSSMNPTNWVNVPGVSVTNSIGALLTVTNFGGAVGPQGFYRFAITP
jgi:uncharacterized repeat protein (TIGR03803 family)